MFDAQTASNNYTFLRYEESNFSSTVSQWGNQTFAAQDAKTQSAEYPK
jgi:hypothetical protein